MAGSSPSGVQESTNRLRLPATHRPIAPFLFLLVLAIHFSFGITTSLDSQWSIYVTMSIIREGNVDLDEYHEMLKRRDYYAIQDIEGHSYNWFPIGASVVALPIVAAIDHAMGRLLGYDLNEQIKHRAPDGIELFVASFLVAMTAMLIYLVLEADGSNGRLALFVALIFAFGTSAWSTASRALWQHGPSMFMLTIVLYLVVLARRRPWLIQFVSIPLALSYVIRPTNAVAVVVWTVFVWLRYRAYFGKYCLWARTVAVPFLVFAFVLYGSVLPSYYFAERLASNRHFLEALLGNLVSPARGLLVFSPVLAFAVAGMVWRTKHPGRDRVEYFLIAIVVLHWVVISSYRHWWAGYSFGPRFFSDMLPYLMYFLPAGLALAGTGTGVGRWAIRACVATLIAISVFVHYRGATSAETLMWNAMPRDLDRNPERVWDWRDLQFLRGIR